MSTASITNVGGKAPKPFKPAKARKGTAATKRRKPRPKYKPGPMTAARRSLYIDAIAAGYAIDPNFDTGFPYVQIFKFSDGTPTDAVTIFHDGRAVKWGWPDWEADGAENSVASCPASIRSFAEVRKLLGLRAAAKRKGARQ